MMLQALYELALREGLLEDPDYEPGRIHVMVELDAEGRFLGLIDRRGEKNQGEVVPIPRFPKRTSGISPQLLVDNYKYVLGLADPKKRNEPKDIARAEVARQRFADCVHQAAEATGDVGVQAVDRFLSDPEQRARLLTDHPAEQWSVEVIAFRLVTDELLVHQRPAVRQYWSRLRAGNTDSAGPLVRCLVTGQLAPPAPIHPNIKRLPEGQPSGTALVSFNAGAFESHGFKQGANAPVSTAAAEGYVAAINRLLEREGERPYRQGVRLGDAVMIYWTREPGDFAQAVFSVLEEGPEDWRVLIESPFSGKKAEANPDTFYALTLSANVARTVVRDWFAASTRDVAQHLEAYIHDFALDPLRDRPIPMRALLGALEDRAGKGVPDDLATRLISAALRGTPLPLSLLAVAVRRMRHPPDNFERTRLHARVALIKATLLRHTRRSPRPLEIPMALDYANIETSYLLGRLFAVLERLQAAALGDLNASIRDRYFGAASSTPGVVFPRLLRLAMHHAAKAERAGWLEKIQGEIVAALPAAHFPRQLGLEDQGLFAIGYYHQRQAFFTKKTDATETDNPSN